MKAKDLVDLLDAYPEAEIRVEGCPLVYAKFSCSKDRKVIDIKKDR